MAHEEQPVCSMPRNFGLGEAGGPHQAGHAVGAGCGTGLRKGGQRQVGRLQGLPEDSERRGHGYSVLTLMEPMLSMATSWSAEAL